MSSRRLNNKMSYRDFMSNELRRQREDDPTLPNTEYMVRAAKEWRMYKDENEPRSNSRSSSKSSSKSKPKPKSKSKSNYGSKTSKTSRSASKGSGSKKSSR